MRKYTTSVFFLITFLCFSCSDSKSKSDFNQNVLDLSIDKETLEKKPEIEINPIHCDSTGCEGIYQGEEFINGSDVAHQFSNKMSRKVGDQLKKMFNKGHYSKVDFTKIKMITDGMGSGNVIYKLSIPFKSVETKCEAYTSFDHVGGWNHRPDFKPRIEKLKTLLIPGEKLDVSDLKTTSEGLQEYWIQWKNKELQTDCSLKKNRKI